MKTYRRFTTIGAVSTIYDWEGGSSFPAVESCGENQKMLEEIAQHQAEVVDICIETKYDYSISEDFPNHKVNWYNLRKELGYIESLTNMFLKFAVAEDAFSFHFNNPLSTEQQTALDGIVAAHLGYNTTIEFRSTAHLVNDSKDIIEQTDWQILGGVVTNVQFFVPKLEMAIGRIIGDFKADGEGAQLRIVESDGETDVVMITAPYSIEDTEGAWKAQKFVSNVTPRAGDMSFRLEGRLNGSTSAAVRFTSMSLLEVVPCS